MPEIFKIQSTGQWPYPTEVVGETRYRARFEKLFGPIPKKGVHQKTVARLVLEPDNRHDPNAVFVEIDGVKVGYLKREDAQRYHGQLQKLGVGQVTGECGAYVAGGFEMADGERADFGVRLDLDFGDSRGVERADMPVIRIPLDNRASVGRMITWLVIMVLFVCVCASCYAIGN